MKKIVAFSLIFLLAETMAAQVGINNTLPKAQLDISASNVGAPSPTDGILIPRVNTFPTINPTADQDGMLVFLSVVSGTNQPGFYYWKQATTAWIPIVSGNAGGTLDQAYDFGGPGLGKTITADTGAVLINGTDGLVSTGTVNSGVVVPSGVGTRMVWNPRKSAFRAGTVLGGAVSPWDDPFVGQYSAAFGFQTQASGIGSVAFGFGSEATGENSAAFGSGSQAMGTHSTTFGNGVMAIGNFSVAFGQDNTAFASHSTAFGHHNNARSYGETAFGIGATDYTPSTNGTTQFRPANATDRLLTLGNAIDLNSNGSVDPAERRDAIIVLKNGLTRLPSTTNAMITAADGKAVVTKEYLQGNTSGTLDQAYDFGGAGVGKTITADAGAVLINGTDGLVSTGIVDSGAIAPSGQGIRMVWNPAKAAFRAGSVSSTGWDNNNIGYFSTAFGENPIAIGISSIAVGTNVIASNGFSQAFGLSTTASGPASTAFGAFNTASRDFASVFGYSNIASGFCSNTFGTSNNSISYGETVLGIGATNYIPTTNGNIQFRTTNRADRLFVVGNAIDTNNNNSVDPAERSDALIILKSGLARLPSATNAMITAADGKAIVTKEYLQGNTSGTLDQAYDFGGAGLGKTITADAGAVLIDGTDGLVATGTLNSGAIAPSGAGTRMVWNPRKGAFRAGRVFITEWDDTNIGVNSVAFGSGTIARGNNSAAFGTNTSAGPANTTAFGDSTSASGLNSTVFGTSNNAISFGETVIGIGATTYSPSSQSQFGAANATDRLFVIGNAIDSNNNNAVDTAELSDAMVILKNGNTGIGTSTPTRKLHIQDNSTSTTAGQLYLEQSGSGDALIHIGNTGARHFNLGLDTSDDSFKIGTSATSPTAVSTGTLMKIQATGEVGIGTVTPDRKLEVSGTGIQYARVTSISTTPVGLELKRTGSDWQMRNDGGDLIFAQSNDDLATVTDVVRVGGGSFTAVTDNAIPLGQNTRRWLSVHATNGVIQTSDANDKKQMLPLTYGLEKIKSLRPISFEWKDNNIDNASTHLGFVAQEVQQVLPEVIVDYDWEELPEGKGKTWKKTDRLGMKYAEIIPVLVKAVQEQQTMIEAQKIENNTLKIQIEIQSNLMKDILKRLEAVESNN